MVVSLALSAGGCTAPPSDSTPSPPFLRLHDRESPNEPDDDPDGGNSIPIYPAQPPGPPGDPQ